VEIFGIRKEISNGVLNLFFDEPLSGTVRLLDSSGRTLYQRTLFGEANFVNVGKFPKGIYILQIEDIGKRRMSKKIIIN
jgi:hypothetical protein